MMDSEYELITFVIEIEIDLGEVRISQQDAVAVASLSALLNKEPIESDDADWVVKKPHHLFYHNLKRYRNWHPSDVI